MTAAAFPPSLANQALVAMTNPFRRACAVRLVDRRTGLTHRLNGSPLVLFTRNPVEAVAELLSGRDAHVWKARIEPIGGAE
ncbi:MAG: hypothetical protein V4753_00255 [Pseudomonadota bacterium]